MTERLAVAAALLGWFGATLLLSSTRSFRRAPTVARLAPYLPVASGVDGTSRWSAETLTDVVGPLVTGAGERLSGLVGIAEPVDLRLARAGSPLSPLQFRLRQAGWAAVALLAGALAAAAAGLPAPVATLVVLGAPLLAALVLEQRITAAATRWQARSLLELPVVIEQLGLLLTSGYSLSAAISRLGRRGDGACAGELRRVAARVRHGVTEVEALREWSERAGVDAIDRLVGVLSLNWEAGDLGALIAAEARVVRREVHRGQIEAIQRRSQQVWIPVTVATLVPGVIFMAVPFLDAMQQLTGR